MSQALFCLKHNLGKRNQSIIISGESGAGKTYSSRLALQCIARKHQNCGDSVINDILSEAWSAVPLLTAFGKLH